MLAAADIVIKKPDKRDNLFYSGSFYCKVPNIP
jgi:hypothetical protein